jgi:hypothetical protein
VLLDELCILAPWWATPPSVRPAVGTALWGSQVCDTWLVHDVVLQSELQHPCRTALVLAAAAAVPRRPTVTPPAVQPLSGRPDR